ncbi:hypothetical protein M8J77_015282 [Diaphorina citri]|nr:hypothetical protein M8J77_015282 [Diaphorina citri]
MANSSLCTEIEGQCKVDLKVVGLSYKNICLLIMMKNLCSDVIIGHDVLSNHSTLEIAFDFRWIKSASQNLQFGQDEEEEEEEEERLARPCNDDVA